MASGDDPSVYYARIRTEAERLNAMVGDLFELSRIQAGVLPLALSPMSVHDLVDDALGGADLLARELGVRLIGDVMDPLPIEVDGRAMTRVLANLLANAIHRTPADGTVAVAARSEADTVVLSVTDGCGGIPADDLPRVFDTGWRGTGARTTPAGAGLGLAIVRGIVEAHSGRTAVQNVLGGCRFEVVLPVAGRCEAAQTESADRGPGFHTRRSKGLSMSREAAWAQSVEASTIPSTICGEENSQYRTMEHRGLRDPEGRPHHHENKSIDAPRQPQVERHHCRLWMHAWLS
jgi:hypothetical protein